MRQAIEGQDRNFYSLWYLEGDTCTMASGDTYAEAVEHAMKTAAVFNTPVTVVDASNDRPGLTYDTQGVVYADFPR